MNVGQLIQRLSVFPSDMPVVVDADQHDGIDYEVMAVNPAVMQHEVDEDRGYRMWLRVARPPAGRLPRERYDPPQDVVYLRLDRMEGGQA